MNKIVNLTQHPATMEQREAGVFDLEGEALQELKRLLTFEAPPTKLELVNRGNSIAKLACATGARQAMIGGVPYFMSKLEGRLYVAGVEPIYSFSTRESVEETLPDGSVRKTNVFRHGGWVRPVRRDKSE